MEYSFNEADRRYGVLVGLAAGDKNGGPTQIALTLWSSLKACKGYCEDHVKEMYITWWKKDGWDCGPTFDAVMTEVENGMTWRQAVDTVHNRVNGLTTGCNPTHRSFPIALSTIPTRELIDIARKEAAITHKADISGLSSAFSVLLCRNLIEGIEWRYALQRTSDVLSNYQMQLPIGFKFDRGGHSLSVLAAAIHFIDESPNFDVCLERALDFAGPDNYCPVVVGAIGGARWGASSVPPDHLEHLAPADRHKLI